MSDREITSEIAKKEPSKIEKFDQLFKDFFITQRDWGGEEELHYPRFRALKNVFSSEEFNDKRLTFPEAKELVDHLLKSRKYSFVFRDWIRVQNDSWDAHLGSPNVVKIHALGRNELLRRDGKKAISG